MRGYQYAGMCADLVRLGKLRTSAHASLHQFAVTTISVDQQLGDLIHISRCELCDVVDYDVLRVVTTNAVIEDAQAYDADAIGTAPLDAVSCVLMLTLSLRRVRR